MKLIRKKSKYFNFFHYFNEKNNHLFSTEIVDGKEKRIDKKLAIDFEELAKIDIENQKYIKKIFNILKNRTKYIIFNGNIENFKYQVDIELKKLTNNKMQVSYLTEKQILALIDFSKNNYKKEFSLIWYRLN